MLKELVLGLWFVRDELTKMYNEGIKSNAIFTTCNTDRHEEMINERISALLGTVDERKIIKVDSLKGIIYMNNQMLDGVTVHNFKQEAEVIVQLGLWKSMEETIKASAHKRIFVDSKDLNDIMAGKMALYNLDLMKKILTVFLAK